MQLFALAQPKLDLHAAVLKIQREWDERNAVLHDTGVELDYLALVHQKPARTDGVFIENVAVLIGTYVHPAHEQLSVLYRTKGILKIHVTCTDGLDLGSGKLYARFKPLQHEVLVECFAVAGYFLHAELFRGHSSHILSGRAYYSTATVKIKEKYVNF